MTWTLALTGHLAGAEEEREIQDKCAAFVAELAADPRNVVSYARFGGTYGSFEKVQAELEASRQAEAPPATDETQS